MRLAAAVASLVISFRSWSAASVGKSPRSTVAALKSWIEAVKTHTPGRVDAPVVTVAALSYEARAELNVGMEFFLHVLMGGTYDTKGNPAAKMVAELARAGGNPDADSFLKQAAILHADVAAYGDRAPIETSRTAKGAGPRTEKLQIGGGTTTVHSDGPVPPLLTQNRLVLARDGQILGEAVASWNWPFGRSLLDLVGKDKRALQQARKSRSEPDPFVSAWYHATTAYMFANGLYGDATPHLQHAAEMLPDDAQILFDRGCYAELMGLPMHQVLLSEDAIANRRADGGHRDGPPTWTPPRSAPPLRIPTADKANAEAERLYRRAVVVESVVGRSASPIGAPAKSAQAPRGSSRAS